MGFKIGIHLLMMPELQSARKKDRGMEKGKKSFKNLNIERIVLYSIILYSFLVFVLSFTLFDETKAYMMTGALYIVGVIIFLLFLVVRSTVIQSVRLFEVVKTQFHEEELPVRPEELNEKPSRMSYIYQVLGVLIALTLFGVWVRYTDYGGFRYVSPYSSYIITGGMISILLLWVIVQRIKEEKGDLIKGL